MTCGNPSGGSGLKVAKEGDGDPDSEDEDPSFLRPYLFWELRGFWRSVVSLDVAFGGR